MKHMNIALAGLSALALAACGKNANLAGEWIQPVPGMPQITHVYVDNSGYETTFTLLREDPRYALPIPEGIIRRNSNLTQN